MKRTFALVGNQNCGKTTLFNALTGSNAHVGNFPGVTVDKKEGPIKGHENINLVDLPGIYSLSPYTSEEIVTRDFLMEEKPDLIINIIDASNIERNLYLTLQLLELNIPMVIALSMMDEVIACGNSIDIDTISKRLNVECIPIQATKNQGTEELIAVATDLLEENAYRGKIDFCSGYIHKAIHSISHIIEANAEEKNLPVRFCVSKIVEGDSLMEDKLELSDADKDIIMHIVDEMEKDVGLDRAAAIAEMRYDFIENLCSDTVHKVSHTKEHIKSVKIDNFLTNKYFAIPIFILIMGAIFYLTFGVIGAFLSDAFELLLEHIKVLLRGGLTTLQINPTLRSLIIDGAYNGISSVLSFLPIIVTLFFFLSLLEDSGYMARIAFIMDKPLRKIGLSGKSFVPMLIGFGCSVPGIMATRTLTSSRDRKMTVLLTPFMSCSAKLPIYTVFAAAFFGDNLPLVMICFYLLGILTAVFSGFLLKNTIYKGESMPFVMELPPYRLPSIKSLTRLSYEKAKDFVTRAFTIIFVASVLIWLLENFDFRFNMVDNPSSSILASIGNYLAIIFKPLGFGDWKFVTSLIAGFSAKEVVVSTLAVLTGSTLNTLPQVLSTMLSLPAAISFLTFTLLYMPCAAAFAAAKREIGSFKGAVLTAMYQTGIAYVIALIVYNIAKLIL